MAPAVALPFILLFFYAIVGAEADDTTVTLILIDCGGCTAHEKPQPIIDCRKGKMPTETKCAYTSRLE